MIKKDAEIKHFKPSKDKKAEVEAPERYTVDDLVKDSEEDGVDCNGEEVGEK